MRFLTQAVTLAVFSAASIMAGGAQAATVYTNNFNSGSSAGFTGGFVTTAPSGEKFLSFGGAGGSATLTITGLTPGAAIDLSFTLDAVGSMDGNGAIIYGGGPGDYFDITANSTSIFHQAFANYSYDETQSYPVAGSPPGTGFSTINALGYTGFPSATGIQDAEYTFNLTGITSNSSTVTFTFNDDSNEGAGNEFYGIDNVVVSASGGVAAVPLPASAPLFGAGLIALGAAGYAAKRKKAAATA